MPTFKKCEEVEICCLANILEQFCSTKIRRYIYFASTLKMACYWDKRGNCVGRCGGFGGTRNCVLDTKYNCVCACGLDENAQCSGWCAGDQACKFYQSECRCGREEEKKYIDPTIQLLINRQRDQLPSVLQELRDKNKKVGHWIWWVFPGTQEGRAEPFSGRGLLYGRGKTKVTLPTAAQLLINAPPEWKDALELICNLLINYGYQTVFPSGDWGRISYFCDFWSKVPRLPRWLRNVIICILTSKGYVDVDERRRVTLDRMLYG